jgi:LysM repeat protein
MKKCAFLLFCLMPLFCKAQLMACRDFIKDGYDFWLYLPDDYATSEKKPLVLFLHGKSLSGHNLNMVRNYGCIDAVSRGRMIDAVVVAPQTAGAWQPAKVMEVVDWVTKNYKVDMNRFYVLGMSMGGYGTLDFVATYPDKVAAAMALCGGATVPDLCGLNEVPLWIIHGTADTAVPVGCSERVVEAMANCGDTTRLIFDRFKGVNHTRLARVFYLEETYDWLFAHTLSDSVRMPEKNVEITTETLKTAYDDLTRNNQLQVVDAKKPSDRKYYVVKKGDTLSSIAVENQTTVTLLCKLNKMKKTSVLQIGRKLRVK